jgi:PAS domain S-box-containing protein
MPEREAIGRNVDRALLDVASRYRAIVENSPDWIWECDLRGNTLYSNPGVVQTLGYSPDELKRLSLQAVIHPDDRARMEQTLSAAIAGREGWRNVRLRWRHRDGSYRELESSASPVFGQDGTLMGFHGVDRDVTERCRAEDALRASELRFAAVFQASPMAVSIARLSDGRFLAANSRYEVLFGWQNAELVGRTSVEVGLWPDPRVRRAWVEALGQGRLGDYRTIWRRRDGVLREVSISGEILAVDGDPCVLAFVQDITEIGEAQRRLREKEAMFRQITETIPEVFWIVAPDWNRVIYVSPAYERIWGKPAASLSHDPLDWANSMVEGHREAVLAAIPTPEQLLTCELVRFPDYQIRRPDGGLRWISARGYPVRDDAGRVLHFAGIAEDITERKRGESELLAAKKSTEDASADKSRFLAAASHDLRQPLQAVALFASALERTALTGEQRAMTGGLMRAAVSLGGLLDSLLDVSRLDAGVVRPSLRAVDLFDIFRRVDNEFSGAALAKGLRFKLCFPTTATVIDTDPELLMAMLRNIVANALAYTERGGVLVGVRRRKGLLLMEVWDTGVGIGPQDLPHIYDEFFQVDNPQRDRSRGLGLGLAIVRRLATLMGYRIECRSRRGRGSVFALWIPCAAGTAALPAGSRAGAPEAAADPRGLEGRRIVLIEDDRLVADSVCAWLASFGAVVSRFSRADDALDDPRAVAADVFVTDYRLPGSMNGVEFLQAVQRRRPGPVRGVIITGDTTGRQAESLDMAEWEVLHKPIEAQRLLAAIAGSDGGLGPP